MRIFRSVFSASLNGVSLTGLDERIQITDIAESPQDEAVYANRPEGAGQFLQFRGRKTLKVTLHLFIKAWDPEVYMACMEKICGWAGHGVLRVNYRPGQLLRVRCSQYPKGAPQDWTKGVTLEFTAFVFPYWRTDAMESVTVSNGNLIIVPEGNGPHTFLEGRIRAGSACQELQIRTVTEKNAFGEQKISCFRFTGLGLAAGDALVISYDENDYLRIRKERDGTSVLICRTGESSDDLILCPGKENTVEVTGDAALFCELSARGVWR